MTIAPKLLVAIVLAGAAAAAGVPAAPAQAGSPSAQDDAGAEPTWRDHDAAVEAARAQERFAIVVWAQRKEVGPKGPLAAVLDDPEVGRWIDERGVLSFVDLRQNSAAAARNGVRVVEVPCLDILRQDGLRIARLRRGSTATDFLATVIGYSSGEALERPEGEAAKEPFRWLAWGNQRFLSVDADAGPDATDAYRWLLSSADAYRPGFRAKFLEFLINRLNQNRARHDGARETLVRELQSLRRLIIDGAATRRDAYEYTRFAHWLRQESALAEVFVELGRDAGEDRAAGRADARLWLFDAAVPELARAREHVAIGELLGDDPGAYFRRRIAALPPEAPGNGGPEATQEPGSDAEKPGSDAAEPGSDAEEPDPDFAPLEHALPDSAGEIHGDAGWVYFALLDAGRGDDAAALVRDVARALPGVGIYAECANRAIEHGSLDEAERVIAEGREAVGEDDRRLRRIGVRLESAREIEKRDGGSPGTGDGGDGGDGDGDPRS